ncbi:MAG TPA: DegT/DnrJ/EryC1/StrS family aminotransferase [Acidimicrobiales bacterium]|nr:DegT/DnrJ/EryC1/StrS family aminotransferase [Acidimicrobiales bacterium]
MTAVDQSGPVGPAPAASARMIPVMRPWLGEAEAEAAAAAVLSGWVAQGPRVAEFESAFARRVDAAHAVAVSSCTTGLHLALVLAGVGPGDEVVVPSLSFIATANAARYVGATPVFADVDLRTQNLTPDTVAPVLTAATRAVVLVDQAGIPADIDAMRALCDPRGITVVQDAACAIGATWQGAPVGGRAELAAFSFHPRKVITTGEGGMLTVADAERAGRGRRLREHGMSVSAADRHRASGPVIEQYLETGFNFRMTDIQAAVGLVQLAKLDEIVERRRALGARYQTLLAQVPGLADAVTAADPAGGTTNFQSFWLLLPDGFPVTRDELMARLTAAGVSARRGIMASHLEPAYADAPRVELPVTERLTRRSLILPLFHDMSESDQDHVVDAIAAAARPGG